MVKRHNKSMSLAMFKQRLITGLILAPMILLSIYYSNNVVFIGVTAVLLIACGIEWLQLIPVTQLGSQFVFVICLLIAINLAHFVFYYWLGLGLLVWLLIVFALCSFPKSQVLWGTPPVVVILSIVLLPLFSQSLIRIYQMPDGKAFIVYLLFLVWGADVGGYFAGKRWGQHKLIPAVSPGKTIEGVIGGGILSAIVALLTYFYSQHNSKLILWMLMAIVVFIMALIGDLFISMLKRRVHLKDTGHLIPGHGGILDRLDSLIAAAPAFYAALCWLNQGT